MIFSFIKSVKNAIIFSDPQSIVNALPILQQLSGIRYIESNPPLTTEFQINNFGFFIEKIKFGTDLPIVIGSANDNKLADYIETKFIEQIELTGILSLRSNENAIRVENRAGSFLIEPQVTPTGTVESSVLLCLRDFQKDCIYICGLSNDANFVGTTGLLTMTQDNQIPDINAYLIRGLVSRELVPVSSDCFHVNSPKIQILSITNLLELNQDFLS